MSDTQRSPLWKQLVGALAGAAVAFVLYNGYTFTTTHLMADVVPPGPIVDAVGRLWPSSTVDSPKSASSASASFPSAAAVSSSRVFLGPFGSIRGLKKFYAFNASSQSSFAPVIHATAETSAASSASSASSVAASSGSAEVVDQEASSSSEEQVELHDAPPVDPSQQIWPPVSEPAPPAPVVPAQPLVASVSHASTLPQSGFGLDVLAVSTLGAMIGRKRAKKA